MHEVIEAVIDETGQIVSTKPLRFSQPRRAFIIILDETNDPASAETLTYVPTPPLSEGVGRYRIDRMLRDGGMSHVFTGTDLQSGQDVCIKHLRSNLHSSLIVQEWHTLARIDSPHVVRFLDRYDHGGTIHLVMEFISGQTLANSLNGGLTLRETAWLGYALMQGIRAIHKLHVIHCDLTPQNVILQTLPTESHKCPWIPKIIDFGLAILDSRDADGRLTACGRIAGTPRYMAPEQFDGWMLSPACDIYAFGLILWEAITGRHAFEGDFRALRAAKANQVGGLRLPLDGYNVPSEIGELLERCTDPDPAKRPSSEEAIQQLDSWLKAVN